MSLLKVVTNLCFAKALKSFMMKTKMQGGWKRKREMEGWREPEKQMDIHPLCL